MKLVLSSNLDKSLKLSAQIRPLAFGERLPFALKRAGIFVAVAFGCFLTFVPVFHVVLFLLFLALSIWAFFKAIRVRNGLLVEDKANCLDCGHGLAFPDRVSDDLRIKCRACDAQLLLMHD